MLKTYTLIGGVNGTGKSSLTGVLKNQVRDLGIVIDVDKLTANMGSSAIKAGRKAVSMIDDCLLKGINFTQETTLSGVRTEKTIKKAKAQGYYIRMFYVGLNCAEESIERIKNRVAKGGHNIPSSEVLRRYKNRTASIKNILPYCDEAVFFDNYNGFVQVAEYRNGEIIIVTHSPPDWIFELTRG